MKSKVKYAALVLVIGLLSLVILPSPVFGGGPKTYKYNIIIDIDGKTVAEFEAAGNKDGTRIVGDEEFQQGMPDVEMYFTKKVVAKLDSAQDEASSFNNYPEDRPLYWSPLEDDWVPLNLTADCHRFPSPDHWQDLNSNEWNQWEYHSGSLDYRKETLSFRFDMFYEYYDENERGAHDHYILGIEMDFFKKEGEPYTYYNDGPATLNWTHYTEPMKPRGNNLQVDFQQLKCSSSHQVTITITEKTD